MPNPSRAGLSWYEEVKNNINNKWNKKARAYANEKLGNYNGIRRVNYINARDIAILYQAVANRANTSLFIQILKTRANGRIRTGLNLPPPRPPRRHNNNKPRVNHYGYGY